ncbi:MAG: hypothetical protein KDA41_02385 [Planctomycetales bacterium]|nr:hypothetical protein [Planctomycetales bacterium]
MRPEGVFILFAIFFVAAAILAFGLAASRAKQFNDVFQAAAQMLGGEFHSGGVFSHPALEFSYDGVRCDVDVHSTGGKNPTYYTQVHLRWALPRVRCEIYPEGFWQRVGKQMLGMEDVQIGSPAFDDAFYIVGDSPALIRQTLSPTVQQAIQQLRLLRGNDHIYVAFRGHEILVKKLGLFEDSVQLVQFCRLAGKLCMAAKAPQTDGIKFVEAAADRAPAPAPVCQVCGDKIIEDVVWCRSCHTPHHSDCWRYYGSCSTYGCQERRFSYVDGSRRGDSQRAKK